MLIFNSNIKGIADDSRKVKKGFVFVAIKGLTVDGHDYIESAVKNGAVVVIGEKDLKPQGVKYIKVKDSRLELGRLASKWYGDPSQKLKIIGVTGTDGKTTTSNLIYWLLKTAGKKVGLISTINAKIGNIEFDTGFHVTNPEPLLLHKLLAEMVKKNCEYAVLEVTSHGLDQERVAGVHFDVGVLTNITHEHLDYHKTFANYVAAKAKLFVGVKYAILNAKNTSSSLVLPYLKKTKVLLYDFNLLNEKLKDAVEERFPQSYNQENATAAIATVRILGLAQNDMLKALKSFPQLIGRMQDLKNNKDIKIIVDFAHTPNALKEVLSSSRHLGGRRLICVYGCAGERDREKRRIMPEISLKLADISVLTAEDPRSENIDDILTVMGEAAEKSGGHENKNFYKVPERGEAINFAINKLAKKGDVVVICGKGHEKSMAYNGVEYPWSDQEAVKSALKGKIKEIPWKTKITKSAVVGFGLEGKDLVNYLLKNNAQVTVFDQKAESELDFTGVNKQKIKLVTGPDYLKKGLLDFDVVFHSPGIRPDIKEFVEARKKGIGVTSAIKLFFDLCPAKIIGVTGTKGKGTTSTLIYEIMKKDGFDVYLAGNIGKPYLELLPKLTAKSFVVLELSSFQLFDLTKSPHIAVVLNITVDHLDWHENKAEYVKAKESIVSYQKSDDFAVINHDYSTPKSFAAKTHARVFYFSRHQKVPGCYVKDKKIFLDVNKLEEIGETNNLQLLGEHNWENITAAICAARLSGASISSIKKTVFSFKGLEHRLEFVKKINDVSFYNDSFSTNPQPTIAAINSFSDPITLILGGSDKGLNYDEMAKEIVKNGQVNKIILIGQIANIIKKSLQKVKFTGIVFDLGMTSMKEVVALAYRESQRGSIVLLSPASASFGMFENYKDRGNQFKDNVKKLK